MHFTRADVHVDVGNVSAIVLTQTVTTLDRSQDWPRSFTFGFTPMIVSDLPNHQDPDEVRPATVAAEANLPPRCKKNRRRLFAGLVDQLKFLAVDLLDTAIEWLGNELGVSHYQLLCSEKEGHAAILSCIIPSLKERLSMTYVIFS